MEATMPPRPLKVRAFRVSDELDDHLRAAAHQRGLTISQLIKQAICAHLPGIPPEVAR